VLISSTHNIFCLKFAAVVRKIATGCLSQFYFITHAAAGHYDCNTGSMLSAPNAQLVFIDSAVCNYYQPYAVVQVYTYLYYHSPCPYCMTLYTPSLCNVRCTEKSHQAVFSRMFFE